METREMPPSHTILISATEGGRALHTSEHAYPMHLKLHVDEYLGWLASKSPIGKFLC
jgi:hypothetical protein